MDLRCGVPLLGACALLALLTGSCAPATTVQTNKAADYSGHPQMLFVATVFDPAHGLNLLFNSFQTSLEAELRDCGVTTSFFALRPTGSDPLQLDTPADPQVAALRAAAASFRPDSYLAVRETAYRMQADTITQMDYMVELSDAASGRAVWKARGTLTRRLSTMNDAGAGLASDIVTHLLQDGILAACKVAAALPPARLAASKGR